LTKGERGRSILLPRRLLQQISAYIIAERAHAVAKFSDCEGWRTMNLLFFG